MVFKKLIIFGLIFSLGVKITSIKKAKELIYDSKEYVVKHLDELFGLRTTKKILFRSSILALNPNRPYNRDAINKLFLLKKKEFYMEGMKRGTNGTSYFTDIYTGRLLKGGDEFDYDHIISSQYIFERYKNVLTDYQIAQVVNIKNNIGPTARPINLSKGKKDLIAWFKKDRPDDKFGVQKNLVDKHRQIAEKAVNEKAQEFIRLNNLPVKIIDLSEMIIY